MKTRSYARSDSGFEIYIPKHPQASYLATFTYRCFQVLAIGCRDSSIRLTFLWAVPCSTTLFWRLGATTVHLSQRLNPWLIWVKTYLGIWVFTQISLRFNLWERRTVVAPKRQNKVVYRDWIVNNVSDGCSSFSWYHSMSLHRKNTRFEQKNDEFMHVTFQKNFKRDINCAFIGYCWNSVNNMSHQDMNFSSKLFSA